MAVISSVTGGRCAVKYKDIKVDLSVPAGSSIILDGSLQII
jgi:hypothetical protein